MVALPSYLSWTLPDVSTRAPYLDNAKLQGHK